MTTQGRGRGSSWHPPLDAGKKTMTSNLRSGIRGLFLFLLAVGLLWSPRAMAHEILPAWNPGHVKTSIVDFVRNATTPGHPEFIPQERRIAVFDNDGTLWAEQPIYFQFLFALDRLKSLAPVYPEWNDKEPFRSVLKGDLKAVLSGGERAMLEVVMATHAGMTTEEFEKVVNDWFAAARHPKTGRPYTEMVYQPMLELIEYLRANGFKTYIVSGGGIEFMRPWTEKIYGIPPEQVIGSSIKTEFEMVDGRPTLMRLPHIDFINDKAGKPVGINRFIGRRPVMAVGNSTGDKQMLEYTKAGEGARLSMLVLHDDAEREYAYGPAQGLPNTKVGAFTQALYDQAKNQGWVVISMKNDWKRVFAFE